MEDDLFEPDDDTPIPTVAGARHPNESLPIAERVKKGLESGRVWDGGIVPFPPHLSGIAILEALTGTERAAHQWRLSKGYRATVDEVRDTDGQLLQVVVRYDHGSEPKTIRPLRYCGKDRNGLDLYWFTWIPGTKPLYGADKLAARPDEPVLVVEGEKTAKAAAKLWPDHVVITWLSGAPGVPLADMSPLAGRQVVVWPDNDVAGRKAARQFAARALEAGSISAAIVDVPREFPGKWDLADTPPASVTSEHLHHLLASARVMSAAEANAVLHAPANQARARRLLGHQVGYSRVGVDVAAEALSLLDPNMAGAEWYRLARCWCYAFGQAGLASFDEWSRGSDDKYKEGEPAAMWAKFVYEEAFSADSLAWMLRKAKRAAEGGKSNRKVDPEALVTAELQAMDEDHAVLFRGSKTVVLRETYDPRFQRYTFEYLKKADLVDFYMRGVQLPGKDGKPGPIKKLGALWFGSAWRREYDGVRFAPGGDAGPRFLNLWSGFSVKPADNPDGWSRLKEHLLNHVAGGDLVAYAYILDWLAAGVQHLDRPNGSALVLTGPKGAGKSILIELYGRLFGPHLFVTSISEDIVGKFNARLEHTLVLGVEEAFAPQNRAADGTLKDLITRSTLRLEDKFFSQWNGRNHLRIIMTSNNDHVVRADGSERRYAVFEVANPHQADPNARRAYFGAMVDQMENGGFEAMLGELLDRDLSCWNPEAIPETEALRKQKLLNLGNDPVRSWYHERLSDGVHIVPRVGPFSPEHDWSHTAETEVPVGDVLDHFMEYCRRNNYRSTERMLSLKIGKLMPEGFSSRVAKAGTVNGTKSARRFYDFPSLADARAAFTAATGIASWEASREDPGEEGGA